MFESDQLRNESFKLYRWIDLHSFFKLRIALIVYTVVSSGREEDVGGSGKAKGVDGRTNRSSFSRWWNGRSCRIRTRVRQSEPWDKNP